MKKEGRDEDFLKKEVLKGGDILGIRDTCMDSMGAERWRYIYIFNLFNLF
jgi:hypothetical protein